MKKFICGLLVGLILSLSFAVYAAEQFIADKATFPIFVNGKEWKSDMPIVAINGSTYLPLKAIAELLDVKVKWNSELHRVEIGDMPTAEYSYSNPAPLGTAQIIEVEDILQKYKAEISVKEIIRGEEAWKMIKEANMFNGEAPDGYEYVLAKIYFKLLNINEGQSYRLSDAWFDLVSSDGKKYDYASVVEPNPSLNAELYKGASHEGWAAFLVKKDDKAPKLVFGRKYDGSGGIWFKAYKD